MSTALTTRRDYSRFEQAARTLIDAKRSPHTRRAYHSDLVRWMEFCRAEQLDPVAPALGATVRFRDHLVVVVSRESARRVLAAMSAVYRLLLRAGVVAANPFHPAVLSWPAGSGLSKTRLVNDEDANAMLARARKTPGARGARDVAILRLLYDTGLRRSSVAIVKREKYRGDAIETIVKGGKEAELELPKTSQAAVDQWLAVAPESPWLFPSRRGHIHPSTINRIVAEYAKAVGAKHVHPHSFRAAFITAGYDAGLPEHEVQASAHHSDPSTTRRYDRHARGRQVANQVADFRDKKGKGK